jgi:hypothetical protein
LKRKDSAAANGARIKLFAVVYGHGMQYMQQRRMRNPVRDPDHCAHSNAIVSRRMIPGR